MAREAGFPECPLYACFPPSWAIRRRSRERLFRAASAPRVAASGRTGVCGLADVRIGREMALPPKARIHRTQTPSRRLILAFQEKGRIY